MAEPFDVKVKGDLFTIINCDYWIVINREWSETEPQEGGNAKPTRAADPFELTVESASVLPPEVGPVVSHDDVQAVQAAVKAGKSWKTLDRSVRGKVDDTDTTVVEFRSSDYGMLARLKEICGGDFTGRGSQEILLLCLRSSRELNGVNKYYRCLFGHWPCPLSSAEKDLLHTQTGDVLTLPLNGVAHASVRHVRLGNAPSRCLNPLTMALRVL
ncbi:MAG TPA: hypothetical protein VN777_07275 [Terriglobales bacterium]|nr:hypothetical protein [Terriglobales bacterium]HZW92614.1 hypothetical protein [Candidatus Eremiobacteraceae bacterium]